MRGADEGCARGPFDSHDGLGPECECARNAPWADSGGNRVANANGLNRLPRPVAHEHGRVLGDAVLKGSALVLVDVVLVLQVAELQHRARGKPPLVQLLVVDGVRSLQPFLRARDERVRLREVHEGPPEKDGGVARHVDVLKRAHEERVRLPAAGGPAVERLPIRKKEVRRLLGKGLVRDVPRHPRCQEPPEFLLLGHG